MKTYCPADPLESGRTRACFRNATVEVDGVPSSTHLESFHGAPCTGARMRVLPTDRSPGGRVKQSN